MLFVSAAVYAMSLPMSETHKPIILQKRAKKLGVSLKGDTPDMKSVVIMRLIRPLHMLCTEASRKANLNE